MKKTLFTLLLTLFCATSFAQMQQGIVKSRGRMVNGKLAKGKTLSKATIILNFGNSLVSGENGTFSFNVPSGKTYSLVMAKKEGYTLADPEFTRRTFKYSASNPFYVVLEDENQRQADINAATRKVRKTLAAQLEKREKEIESLKAKNKLTEKEYQERLKQLYDNQSKSEQLVKEMAERYASTDYDQLDEFNRRIQMYIEEGELQKADSMIRSKGDIEKRVEEYHNIVKANKKVRNELEQSEAGAAKTYEDLSQDLLRRSEIFLQEFKQDSALYCLKMRADLDTTNISAVWDYAYFCSEQNKHHDCEKYYHICLRASNNDNNTSNIASLQNNLGSLYKVIHDYTNCEKFYILALKNCEKLFLHNPDAYRADLATIQNNIGTLYDTYYDYTNSEIFYKLALENCEKLFQQNPAIYRADLAWTQNNLGNLYRNLHDYASSEYFYKLALENREQLFRQDPVFFRADLARTQNNFGKLYCDLRDYANSEKFYKLALKNRELLFSQNNEAYRADLAKTQEDLGILYTVFPDKTKCERYLKLALENYEYLFNHNSDAYLSDLATIQCNIGNMYRNLRDFTSSEKYCKLALENCKLLYNKNPDVYRSMLAKAHNIYGSLYHDLRDFPNCEKQYKLALENYEYLFNMSPNAHCKNLALLYWDTMLLYADMENLKQHDKFLENTLKLYKVLYKKQPSLYQVDIIKLQNRKVRRLLMNGNNNEALTLARKTYDMDETNEKSKEYLAKCYNAKSHEYAEASDFANAYASINKAIQLFPNNVDYYNNKGLVLLMQGKNLEALEVWKQILKLSPDILSKQPNRIALYYDLKKLGLTDYK